jgi:hypothetical protein
MRSTATFCTAVTALALLALPRVAAAQDLWGGIGGGEYVYNTRSGDPKLIVPFTEVGVEGRWHGGRGLTWGLQIAVREDGTPEEQTPVGQIPVGTGAALLGVGIGGTPGGGGGPADPGDELTVSEGARWRIAPYVETHWRDLRLRGGLVAGTYYNVTDDDEHAAWVYPMASVAVGNNMYEIELGMLDAPTVAASATGGLGILSLRVMLEIKPGHRVTVGAGAPYGGPGAGDEQLGGSSELGHMSWAYHADFGGTLGFRLGGYVSTDTTGLFVSAGTSL